MGDPDFYDAKIAGWWVWGLCSWIGSGWCGGGGPWVSVDGELVKSGGDGVHRKRPHLGDAGRGINRKRPHLGNAGQGINRQHGDGARHWIMCLAERLRGVRVVCGEWDRVLTPAVTTKHSGICGVFLDPPYSTSDRDECYNVNSVSVGADVWRWALENGDNPKLRIAVCDYEDGRAVPNGWTVHCWKTNGGYAGASGRGRENAKKERIWFSPHCLPINTQPLLPEPPPSTML